MEGMAPTLRAGHVVIISSHCSFGGLYLARLVPGLRVAAWGTTVVTGRRTGALAVTVSNVRAGVDVAGLPAGWGGEAAALCGALFGDRFVRRADLLAIGLSNLNPQNHLAMGLCNATRMDWGEAWANYRGVSPAVGRLIEALDQERLAVAAAFGCTVRTVFDHFELSFGVPRMATVAAMAAAVDARGNGPMGPTTLDSRYLTEDVPFCLVPTERLAALAGVEVPLHTGGIALCSALLGRDFRAENDLWPLLGIEAGGVAGLRAAIQ